MSRVQYQSLTTVALDATGFAAGVAYAAGGYALSATSPGDGCGHLVTFANLSGNSHAAQTITFAGTDENGSALSQSMAGPAGNATISPTAHFKTLSKVTASGSTGADTFNVGWTADAVGPNVHVELDRVPVINVEVHCTVPVPGPTYGVDYTSDANPAGLTAASWLPHATIAGKTATFDGQITAPVRALRLHFTGAGQVNMTVVEPFHA